MVYLFILLGNLHIISKNHKHKTIKIKLINILTKYYSTYKIQKQNLQKKSEKIK
jgi:DMSO/TMAO reductase YedYZ heme-binding membrane subunit